MSGASISMEVRGIRALEGFMGKIAGADTRILMERVGIVGENAVSDNFEGEHSPDGVPWKPSFRARTTGGKTLTDKGLLAGSIESHATADEAEIGSNLIYARTHNEGGVISGNPFLAFQIPGLGFRKVESVTMPQRQFLGWSAESLADVDDVATEWLADLLPPGALS